MSLGIPNILNQALSVIGSRSVLWSAYQSRAQNARGMWASTYAAPVPLAGSWQPVSAKRAKERGLDAAKNHHTLWVSAPIEMVRRMASPDRVIVDGATHEIISITDWHGQNGWREATCVEVSP